MRHHFIHGLSQLNGPDQIEQNGHTKILENSLSTTSLTAETSPMAVLTFEHSPSVQSTVCPEVDLLTFMGQKNGSDHHSASARGGG